MPTEPASAPKWGIKFSPRQTVVYKAIEEEGVDEVLCGGAKEGSKRPGAA